MNFIEKNTKKVALVLCLATAGTAVTTVYAAQNSDGWHGSGTDRVYKMEGQVKTSSWVFDEAGSYYLNNEGHPITSSWKEINGSTYYFDAEGHRVNGKQVIDGHEYTFQKSGVLLTGWNEVKDTYYNEFGVAVTGVQKIDNKTYNFGEDGKLVTGWTKVNGKIVYFTKDGSLASGVVTIDGKKYNFNDDGTITTGWVKKDGEKYYYTDYGFMTKGWKTIDGKKYYFNKKGQAATKTEYAGYKFDKNGVAKKIKKKEKAETTDNASEDVADSEDTASNGSGRRAASSSKNLGAADGGIASAALAQLGVGQDCTALASNALAAQGVYFHGWPAEYMSLGSVTSSPQPGDLIYYDDAGAGVPHIAVYVGNGQAVHGGWKGGTTVEASAYIGSGPVFIRVNK